MSPTSYLTAPPRVAAREVTNLITATSTRGPGFSREMRRVPAGSVPSREHQARRRHRPRHQLVTTARRRRGRRRAHGGRAPDHRHPAGRGARGQRPAQRRRHPARRGHRGGLPRAARPARRRDGRLRGHQRHARRRERARSSPTSCAGATRSSRASSPATRRRGSPSSAPPTGGLPDDPTLVIDIGGGSTEYVVGRARGAGGRRRFHVSIRRMGSVRHTERHLHSDPPTPRRARRRSPTTWTASLAGDIPAETSRPRSSAAIAVAGTATSLAAIDLRLDPYDPEPGPRAPAHTRRLRAAPRHARRPSRSRSAAKVTGLHPDRAPTIVAGATILVRSLHAFGLGRGRGQRGRHPPRRGPRRRRERAAIKPQKAPSPEPHSAL